MPRTRKTKKTVDDLIRDGILPSLAARFLSASIAINRNILIIGDQDSAWHVTTALLSNYKEVYTMTPQDFTLPTGWKALVKEEPETTYKSHGKPGVCFLGHSPETPVFMLNHRPAICWLPAIHAGRALMNYELQLTHDQGALAVAAGIDLVVSLGSYNHDNPKISAIDEVVLTNSIYRLLPIFSSVSGPFSMALKLVNQPHITIDLKQAGFETLCSELESYASLVAGSPIMETPVEQRSSSANTLSIDPPLDDALPTDSLHETPMPSAPIEPTVEIPTPEFKAVDQEHAPGWELDMLIEKGHIQEQPQEPTNTESQEMAATFGFGPPQKPRGLPNSLPAPQPAQKSQLQNSFQSQMKKLKEDEK